MKKNLMKKIFFIILICIGLALVATNKSYAATNISISTSKSSVTPGESFTVTVSAVGAGPVSTTVTNGSGGKREFLDNSSYSFTCTAGSSGTVQINASGTLGDYETGDEAYKSASKTVKIVENSTGGTSGGSTNTKPSRNNTTTTIPKETKKSSDSTLSGLTVTEGAITPEFNKNTKEYTLTIPNELTEINVIGTTTDSKATIGVTGNTNLVEGENTLTVSVTAEDGSVTNYIIKVTRKRAPLALNSLIIKYTNQTGELIELPLSPTFNVNTLEYSLEDLEYWVEKLQIEAIANIEGAIVDIQDAEELKTGENIITIIATIKDSTQELPDGEEPKEEKIVYTIKVNKKAEPTLLEKILNKFKGIFGGITTWYNNNKEQIVLVELAICVVALAGLSVYIIIDNTKYVTLIEKLKKLEEINENTVIQEKASSEIINNTLEETDKNTEDKNDKPKRGRHF